MNANDPLEVLRAEMTALDFDELRTAADVDAALQTTGSAIVVVHSVCALSCEVVRPGLAQWLAQTSSRPEHLFALLAGADTEAVARVRQAFRPHRPSAPQIALLQGGKLVHLFQRADLEALDAAKLPAALDEALAAATRG